MDAPLVQDPTVDAAQIPYRLGMAVTEFLGRSVSWIPFPRVPALAQSRGTSIGSTGDHQLQDVDDLRAALVAGSIDPKSEYTIRLRGVFYPGPLLMPGWWEHRQSSGGTLDAEQQYRDKLQEWLFQGFRQWGPSWDFTSTLDHPDRLLVAQLGRGDEANSLPLIIPGGKAEDLRGLLQSRIVFEAEVCAAVIHRSVFAGDERRASLGQWSDQFDYFLIMDDQNRNHSITFVRDAVSYSGYLWQCLAPRAWINRAEDATLKDVYFIWEHTDMANEDAVRYNLDSLARKAEYIRALRGDLVMVQKSSKLVPGEPAVPGIAFYEQLIGGDAWRTAV
jgi:hypothetical protein